MTSASHTLVSRGDHHGLPDIFALVIGINNYSFEKLNCAVNDANEFEKYLSQRLKVPTSSITNLRDKEATRTTIISEFSNLARNDRIKRDEAAIIIYFAGHGTRVEKPQEWSDWETVGDKIEMICPVDMGLKIKPGSSSEEDTIPGIPDRTISVLLDELSAAKGDNITMILDCCHAEGATRGGDGHPTLPGHVTREVYNSPAFHPRIWDREILDRGKALTGAASGFSGKHQASHVLLAASGRYQKAYENSGHGLFTNGLLWALTTFGVDNLTYTALIHRLNMPPWQTPHCKGQHLNRRIFNKKALGTDGSFVLSKQDKILGKSEMSLTLLAGSAQGVTIGSTYEAYGSNLIPDVNNSNPCLATFTVTSVKGYSADLSPSPGPPIVFSRPGLFYCRLAERGSEKMTVYCANTAWVETEVFTPSFIEASSVILVNEPKDAELRICIVGGILFFDRDNPLTSPHIGTRLPFFIEKSDRQAATFVQNIIRCALDFNHHLARTGDDFKGVRMELKAVKEDALTRVYTTVNPNLFEILPAAVVVDETLELHMNIINDTQYHLYPHLFYFDPCQLCIAKWYAPPVSDAKVAPENAPLPPGSQLTLGHGEVGVDPWGFNLSEGKDKEMGFFKLFLTTKPADLSSIIQTRPSRDIRSGSRSGQRASILERWGSQLATVIQLRHADDIYRENGQSDA